MNYVKKTLDDQAIDNTRIALSVRPEKLSPEPCCDFCGAPDPVVVYAANRMSTGEVRTCWRWMACPVCSEAVDHDRWPEMEARVGERLRQLVHVRTNQPPARLIRLAVHQALAEFHHYAQMESQERETK
jgi:hypothetical protein